MCEDDVAALVVDNGSGMVKAGFAGKFLPDFLRTLTNFLHRRGIKTGRLWKILPRKELQTDDRSRNGGGGGGLDRLLKHIIRSKLMKRFIFSCRILNGKVSVKSCCIT